MKSRCGYAKAFVFAVLGIALAAPGIAWANGEEFFQPAGDGKVDLVYFGKIKDQDGKVLDNVNVTISVKNVHMVIPIANDAPGHYRTSDIGAMIKDTGEKIDPTQLEIVCTKDGYKQLKPAKFSVPTNKATGSVEVDFVMQKVPMASASAN